MKLSSLSYVNWRGFESFDLPLSTTKPTILSGPNGTGKTSALQGLEWLLTGKNPTGQPRDTGLLREGAKAGYVSACFADGETARRNVGGALEVEGVPKKAGANAAEQRLMAMCGLSTYADVGRALRPDLFLQLSAKDQGAAFYEILGIKLEKALIEERLTRLQAGTGLKIRDEYTKAYGAVSTNLDATHKALFSARRDAKRDLKEAQTILAAIEADEAEGRAPAFKAEPDPAQLRDVRDRLAALSREQGAIQATAARRARRLEMAAELRAKLEGDKGAEWMAQAVAGLEKLRAQAEEMDNPPSRLARVRRDIANSKETCCPTCSRPWSDADERAARIMNLTHEEAKLLRLCTEYAQIRTRIANGEKLVAEQRELSNVRAQLASLEAELDSAEENAGDELESKIEQVRAEADKLDQQTRDAAESTAWNKRKADARAKVATLEASVKALEELVTLFGDGPTSIKASVLRKAADPVGEQLSATLSLWGMAARLSADLVLEVEKNGQWRPASSCSDGERILVALALQVWLADQTGTRIVLIDRLEALDSENLRILTASAEQLLENGAVDHVLMAGVDIPATLTLAPNPEHELLEV